MSQENEQTLQTEPVRKIRKPKPQRFSMDNWDDERAARKFIKPSFEDIRARLKGDGIKTQFKKVRHEDGIQSYAIFFGREETVTKKDGTQEKKIVFSDNDYVAVHYDPSRKFPRPQRRKTEEESN